MKKVLVLLLSIFLILSSCPVFALAEDGEVPAVTIENPLLNSSAAAENFTTEISQPSVSKKYKGNTYYSSGKQLYTAIKNNLLSRKKTFKIRYLSKGTKYFSSLDFQKLLYEFYFHATSDELSTSSLDGEYLRYNVSSIGFKDGNEDTALDGYYYYTLDGIADYYNTSQQDAAVDNAVNSIVSNISSKDWSDYQKIKYIHDYICNKGTYDHDAMGYKNGKAVALHPTAFTAYGTLIGGKSVCQGYAQAFNRICRELGYGVCIASSDPDRGCHAWNLIRLDGKYYYIDCTWDDEIRDGKTGEDDYLYFLVNYNTVQSNDSYLGEHKLDSELFDNDYFNNKYRKNIDSNNYDRGNNKLLSKCTVGISKLNNTYSGSAVKPAVTVKNPAGEALKEGSDYSLSYSGNINTGAAKAIINGMGEYSGSGFKQFYILPSAVSGVGAGDIASDSATAKWKASGGSVTGYSVERLKSGKWISVTNTSSISAVIPSLASSANQYIRVRAYKLLGKRKLYGGYSKTYFFSTKPAKVKITSLQVGSKKMTVKWKSAARITKYQLAYSTRKDMKKAKTVNLSSKTLSKTVKKLKREKKYYVRVRAYRKYTDPSKKVRYAYGKWSAKKSIKIK